MEETVADTATVEATVIEAGVVVAKLLTAEPPERKYNGVHPGGVEEGGSGQGYHSNEVAVRLGELEVRTYIAEPERGARDWDGRQAEKEAVYGNRRRIRGKRRKRMQRQRGERIERNFAHQFDTGGMDRLYVRGIGNVHKKLLIQAPACNLALLLRSMFGAGKPRAAHDQAVEAVFAILALIKAISSISEPSCAKLAISCVKRIGSHAGRLLLVTRKSGGLDTSC
jgi:transposase